MRSLAFASSRRSMRRYGRFLRGLAPAMRWVGGVLLALAAACGRAPEAGSPSSEGAALSSKEAHGGGTQGFFFLPPLAPVTSYGTYKPGLSPVVTIEELSPGARGVIATFTTSGGSYGATITENLTDHYQVNWDTKRSALDAGHVYRIRVKLDAIELGFVDVTVAPSGTPRKGADAGEYVLVHDGRTLPIKFRIDTNAPLACVGVVCAPADECHEVGACDPATGTCSNPPKPDGSPCDDADACTLTDTCQQGTCTGSAPVTCWPL